MATTSVLDPQTASTYRQSEPTWPKRETRNFWLTMSGLTIGGATCLVASALAILFTVVLTQVALRDLLWSLPTSDPASLSTDLVVEGLTVKNPRTGAAAQAGCWGDSTLTLNVTVRNLGETTPDWDDTRIEFVGITLSGSPDRVTMHAHPPVSDFMPNRPYGTELIASLKLPEKYHNRQMLWTASIVDRNGRVSRLTASNAHGNGWAPVTVGPC